MSEESKHPQSDSSAPSGRVHPLVGLWRRIFKPKSPPPLPVWTGKCDCCGRDVKSFDTVYPEGAKVECLGCLCGISEAGRKRKEERKQVELYKRAIREVEMEKHNAPDQATASE